jgi:iron(III) transport system ATP-binding protein
MKPLLEVHDIECRYRGHIVVDGLSLHVKRGSLVCLLGPSGCGKTTVLRAIAGFEPIHRGEIRIDGNSLSRPGHTVAPEKRRLGMVFQDYALFPHLDVRDNVGFALHRRPAAERRSTVERMLKLVGLDTLDARYPHELSGGQQQRVALARALAAQPEAILLDEPFSNLDVDTRERLSLEVRDILKQEGITGILVTHHQDEAFALGDQVGVMKQGRIQQWDTPFNLYHEPSDRFVADFIGQGSFLRGILLSTDTVETELGVLRGNRAYNWPEGTEVDVLIRPDDIVPDPGNTLQGRIIQKAFKGAEMLYTLELPSGNQVLSLFPSHQNHGIGERVGIRADVHHVVAFRHSDV